MTMFFISAAMFSARWLWRKPLLPSCRRWNLISLRLADRRRAVASSITPTAISRRRKKLTARSLSKFEGYDPKAVLTYCPSCHAHMDFALSETGLAFDVPYLHVTEFIVDNLNRLNFPNRVERRVMFHGHGDNDQARRDSAFARAILGAIPGLEVIDATGTPDWGHDCGNLQISIVGPEKHAGLVTDLFENAQLENVDAVTALYHSCYRNLCPQEKIHGVEVVHYTSLVAEAMGLPPRVETYKRLSPGSGPGGRV